MSPARLNTTEVASKDGTRIALDVGGDGRALILIAGALSDRASYGRLVELLAPEFTVFNYDRRGRGDSGDTPTYAVEREVEDLDAIIGTAREPVLLNGSSSGANLALQAALLGLEIRGLALWEPNFIVDRSRPALPGDYVEHLKKLISAGRRGDAVEYFMTAAVGMPTEFVAPMREAPFWPAQEARAHTLAYDGAVVGDNMSGEPLTADPWASVAVPTLILDGGTVPWMSAGADALANVVPNARRRTLEGQTHDVAPEPVADALSDFFGTDG
jgi:alpha-beta hydrolase superfamily lysophospholipase